MKDLPARERLDIVEKVAEYLVLAASLDKTSPLEDHDRASELSLELAMLLPGTIYRSVVEATAAPGGKCTPATVAILVRRLLGTADDDLDEAAVVLHAPGVADKPRGKAH